MTPKPPKSYELLVSAADTLSRRGLAKGAPRNRSTGAVDVTAALQLVCGVPFGAVTDDMAECVVLVPRRNLPAFLAAWEAVDATVDGLDEWQDAPSTDVDEVVGVLRRVADLLARTDT
jgi:hypothetical protein